MSGIMQIVAAARGTLGPDIVVNGDFSAGTGWTDSGATWTITGGKVDHSGIISTFTNTGGTAPTASRTYRVTYTISNYASGEMRVVIGARNGTLRSANGTYTEDLSTTNTDKLLLEATNFGTWSVDNVSAQEVLV